MEIGDKIRDEKLQYGINPNLGGGCRDRGNFALCWFSLNSETIKAVTLAFCSIQQNFIRDVCAKFDIPYLPQTPDIGKSSDGVISDFQIFDQSLIYKKKLS